jgi:hypothetical protein
VRALRGREGRRGQGLVEFSILLPVFLFILLGMLEFGLAFDHTLTLNYASREGARVGSALALGPDGICSTPANDPSRRAVDQNIVSAVERVLISDGSPIQPEISQVDTITIYRVRPNGTTEPNTTNTWVYNAGGTAAITTGLLPAPAVVNFTVSGSTPWPACARSNSTAKVQQSNPTVTGTDSLGVGITYRYRAQTPLVGILRFFGGGGWGQLPVSDSTVMSLNPTQ